MATAEELAEGDRAAALLPVILAEAIGRIVPDRPCHCRQAMQRYRDEGRL